MIPLQNKTKQKKHSGKSFTTNTIHLQQKQRKKNQPNLIRLINRNKTKKQDKKNRKFS